LLAGARMRVGMVAFMSRGTHEFQDVFAFFAELCHICPWHLLELALS
jgi:hypothetical protein